jgi:hypothetical protein
MFAEKKCYKKDLELKSQLGGSQGLPCVNEVYYGISFQAALNLLHFTDYAPMKYIAGSVFKLS